MLRITPIYGSRHYSHGAAQQPSCTMVEYGGVRVLVNVGWDDGAEPFPTDLPSHEALVITDSSLGALGALPLYHQLPNAQKMYATFPTVKMGQMTLYDHHAALCLDGVHPPYTLSEIDSAFHSLETLKYAQSITVNDPSTNTPALTITAHRAGHVVGGAFYVFQRLQDETVVVVTGTYHISKEMHLGSATLLKYGATPDVLVTRPGGPAMKQLSKVYGTSEPLLPPPLVAQAEKTLVETLLAVLRRDGNVLCPVDASGRVLELLLLLSQHWDRHRLAGTYNLCWVGPMTTNTIEYARSQLEWMHPGLGSQFDSQRGHPYALKNVHICSSLAELDAIVEASGNNPTVVLASGASLDCGPARDLLLRYAENQDHAIILTDSSQCVLRGTPKASILQETSTSTAPSTAADENADNEDTLLVGSAVLPHKVSEFSAAAQLLLKWCEAKLEGREMDDVVDVDVRVPHRAPLAGPELKAFLTQEEAQLKAQKAAEERQAMLREVELAKNQLRLGEEDAAESKSATPKAAAATAKAKFDARPKKKSRFDSSLFLKFSKPLHLMFEVREEAVGIGQSDSTAKYGIGESVGREGEILEDEYGIAVIPERFTDIVTGVDPSKFAGSTGRIGEEVLRRGFGFGVDGRPVLASKSGGPVAGAAHGEAAEEGMEEEMDEAALEAADLSEGFGIIRGRNGRPPTKVSTVPRQLEVLAEIAYVPLEGRVDSRAARQSIRALQPGKVVVLGGCIDKESGETNEVMLLADAVRGYISGADAKEKVLTPGDGETVELNVGHAAYSVRLINTPYVTREEKEKVLLGEKEPPEPLEPFEAQLGECTVSQIDCVATGQKVALDGSIVLAPCSNGAFDLKQPSILLSDGDVLLTDLRSELIAQGMKADYSSHAGYSQLVVNGKIAVKKDQETGKIAVEGPLCEDFFTVRSVVCGQYVTL